MHWPRRVLLCALVCVAWYWGAISLAEVLGDFANQWPWFVLATVYCVLINEIFGHMICAHRAVVVDPRRLTYRVLIFLASVDHAWAPITNLCRYHENHHLHTDQGHHDNLNWRLHWYSVCSLSPLVFLYVRPTVYPNLDAMVQQQCQVHAAILSDRYTQFVEQHRIMLTLIFWLSLYWLLPAVLFKIVFMARFLFSIYMVLAAIGGHTKLPLGYRNFDTPDTTHNNLLFHYIALGLMPSMLQNNHHGGTSTQHRWFEFDTSRLVVRLLTPLLIARQ